MENISRGTKGFSMEIIDYFIKTAQKIGISKKNYYDFQDNATLDRDTRDRCPPLNTTLILLRFITLQ